MSVYRFTEGELKVLRRLPPVKVSEWAARNIVVQDGPYRGARLKPEVNPYLVGIMDAFGEPSVEEVSVCGSPQTGKTLAMYACLGYSIDRRPGTKMLAMPDDKVAARVEAEKLRPLLRGSPALNALVTKAVAGHVRLRDGSSVFLSSAQAPAQRASITVRDLFLDEEDLYAAAAGHGDPVTDFLERTRSYFFGRKIMRVSKPVGDASSSIWRAVTQGASQLMAYEVPCPLCGEYQFFQESQVTALKLDEREATPDEIERLRLGRYRCGGCGGLWGDELRNAAVARGRWAPAQIKESTEAGIQLFERAEPISEPKKVGFHLPAILSWAVSLSELAARELAAKGSDDPETLQGRANGDWARPYVAVVMKADSVAILRRMDLGLAARTVPHGTMALTCGIDTQRRDFYYAVVAWTPNLTKYLIDYGRLPGFDEVERLVFEQAYPVLDSSGADSGERADIWRAAIDTGGTSGEGVYTRTEEVYEFVRRNGYHRLYATKGASRDQTPAVRWSTLDRLPGAQKAIPGGLSLYMVDTGKFKSALFAALLNEDSARPLYLYGHDPERGGQEGLHGELTAHLMAEKLVRTPTGKMAWVQVSRDNHYLDCLTLALACGDVSWTPSLDHMRMSLEAAATAPPAAERRPKDRPRKERAW